MKKFKKYTKRILYIFICYLLYLILGALIPFASPKEVSTEAKEALSKIQYRSDSLSVDRAAILEANTDALNYRLAAVYEARETIIISTFDIRNGEYTYDLFAALLDAADRGVAVQILVDGLSGMAHMGSQSVYYALGNHDNIEIRFYNQPSLLKPWTFNGRLHDKFFIIDDQLLILGGRNIFDYFLAEDPANTGYDRDVLICNTAAGTAASGESILTEVRQYFQDIWDMPVCKTVYDKIPLFRSNGIKKQDDFLKLRYQKLLPEQKSFFDSIDYQEYTVSVNNIVLAANPTHIYAKEPYLWEQLHQLMMQADERVLIHTPYAALSPDMQRDLAEIAAHIPAELLLNSIVTGDNVMASADYYHNKDQILSTGVQVYEFFGDYSSHGKSLVIDNDLAVIGSYNLDMRSTYLDTETMLIIHSEELTAQLSEHIDDMLEQSLAVNSDGSYLNEDSVQYEELSGPRKVFFAVFSKIIQLFRFLV